MVRCTGFHNATPLLEFLSKGSLFSNLTGEKVSEYHVSGAMSDVLRQLDLSLSSYSMAPCWSDETPYYGLFVERGDVGDPVLGRKLAAAVDRRLGESETKSMRPETEASPRPDAAAGTEDRILGRVGPQSPQPARAGRWSSTSGPPRVPDPSSDDGGRGRVDRVTDPI